MLNQAHISNQDTYYNRERPSIVGLVRTAPNVVLDLGYGAGAVGRRLLQEGKASIVVGVELFAAAAQEAAHFDYVLCGDILEHLKDPYSVVKKIHGWLKDDGRLVCSLPNVRHWKVLAELAFHGAWDYQDAGVMERTHLRFFTRRSCFNMLRGAGFEVEQWRMLIAGRGYLLLNGVTFGLFAEFLGSQIVTLARKKTIQESKAGPMGRPAARSNECEAPPIPVGGK
ncbi:MAG: class I SAM-dependent methyltransferase [Verrucomicrobiota bacterium]|jgi:SAM-dependent methyltransferase